jgi:hypothetical protein
MAKTNRSPSGRGKSLPSAHRRAQAVVASGRRTSARESHDEKKAEAERAERAAESAMRADGAEAPILHLPADRQTKKPDEALSRWEGEGGHPTPSPGPASRAAPDSRRATDSRTEKRAASSRDDEQESARETRASDRHPTTGPRRMNARGRDARFPDDKTRDDELPHPDRDER